MTDSTDTGRDAEYRALQRHTTVPPERTERYGEHPAQVIDFYGLHEPGPWIVALHGGFWREAFDRTHLTPFAAALAGRGMRVALVEYRRVGGGGGWPDTAQDVNAALDHLGAPPDVLLGHSAGGQLALWAAAEREHAAHRVLGVAPLADLARAHQLGLSNGAVADFLAGPTDVDSSAGAGGATGVDGQVGAGGTREERVQEGLRKADPMRLPSRVPVELLHGTGDQDVPCDLSRRYANDWGARLHLLPGVGHFAPVTPHTAAFDVLVDALRE